MASFRWGREMSHVTSRRMCWPGTGCHCFSLRPRDLTTHVLVPAPCFSLRSKSRTEFLSTYHQEVICFMISVRCCFLDMWLWSEEIPQCVVSVVCHRAACRARGSSLREWREASRPLIDGAGEGAACAACSHLTDS